MHSVTGVAWGATWRSAGGTAWGRAMGRSAMRWRATGRMSCSLSGAGMMMIRIGTIGHGKCGSRAGMMASVEGGVRMGISRVW
jgi:hypothetical protein